MKIYTLPTGALQANCYIMLDETTGEAAVIDPGAYDERLAALLKNEEIKKIKYILLTHGHFDHIMGVAELKKAIGAPVAIHEADSLCLEDEDKSLASSSDKQGGQVPIKADIILKEGDELAVGEITVKVMHTPGHTEGSVCYICGEAIFSGDTLFCRTIGRTDLPGGSRESIEQSCQRLAELPGDYSVFPGHNRATTLSEERVKNRYLRKLDLGDIL